MLLVPVVPAPSQTLRITLAGQDCRLAIYERQRYGLFLDLAVSDKPIITGTICLNRVRLVQSAYLGFVGDLLFSDTQGSTDPVSAQLGSRYLLAYLEASDL